jgi:RNA polymerase-binding transcription factor DksA
MPEPKQMTEMEKLLLEEQQLRVETLRDQVELARSRKAHQVRDRKAQAETEEFNRRKAAADQAVCAHTKYAVIKHTEPWGETYVMCQRCGKEVRDPYHMLRKTAPEKVAEARKKDPKGYDRVMAEYKEWINFPTDNSPSGAAMFGIQRDVEYAAA